MLIERINRTVMQKEDMASKNKLQTIIYKHSLKQHFYQKIKQDKEFNITSPYKNDFTPNSTSFVAYFATQQG